MADPGANAKCVLLTFRKGASRPLEDTAPFRAVGNDLSPYVRSSEDNAQQRPRLARVMHIQRMDGNSCRGGLPHFDPHHGQDVVLRTQSVQALTCCGITRRWHVLGDLFDLTVAESEDSCGALSFVWSFSAASFKGLHKWTWSLQDLRPLS